MALRSIWQHPKLKWVFVAAVAFPAALNIYLVRALPGFEGTPSRDSVEYWRLAGNLTAGEGYSFGDEGPTRMRQPLYPLFLAATRASFGARTTPPRYMQGLFVSAIVAMCAVLAVGTFGAVTGVAAAVLIALYLPLLLIATTLLTESLYTLLLTGAVLVSVAAARSRHNWPFLLLGLLLGLVGLTRPAGLPLLFALPLVLWLQSDRAPEDLYRCGAIICVGLAVMTPWAVRNYVSTGQFSYVSTDTGAALWDGVHPRMYHRWFEGVDKLHETEGFKRLAGTDYYISASASARFRQAAYRRMLDDPWGVIKRGTLKTAIIFSYLPGTSFLRSTVPWLFQTCRILHLLIMGLALVGALYSPTRLWAPILTVFVVTAGGCFFGPATGRLVMPLMPLIFILTARGLSRPWRQTKKSRLPIAASMKPS